jgi:hypothetical protein
MTAKFSIGEVDKPTQESIVKGFHRYTRAAISPQGRIPLSCDDLRTPSGLKFIL